MSSESRPLLPKKTVPSPLSPARASHTMSKPLVPHSPSTAHTALASLPPKVSSRATTPTRNVSAGPDARFKVPALPSRLMTPSTSTVAHSSSPRRAALSSSPPRDTSPTQPVQLTPGLTLVFGRHRHHAPGSSAKSSASASATKLTTSVPRHLLHLLSDASPSRPAEIVHLPRSASHASRVHATVEYIAAKDSLRIVVIGQNGLRVKRAGTGSRRLKSGQRMDLAGGDGNRVVQIDFYGCKVDVAFPAVEEPPETLFSPMSSPISAPPSPATSMPPSSPPMMLPSSPIGDHSSPLSSNLEVHARSVKQELLDAALSHDDLIVATTDAGLSRTPKTASRPATPAPQREPAPVPPVPHVLSAPPSPPAPLPDGVDLAAILASTVVFSGSSKLSLPDLVKHMLETQPSLREHGDEQRWTDWAKDEVEGNAMFGKVERHGKDASGHPLLPHYFYNPAHDPDTNRAKQLGGLVRPLRAAQRAGGKAIDWRPVGGGRRR
ncbi:hypothetical protein EHS25_000533 [Saitozyma podzolica]|uniref:FHA domain-containing protein n=1 Tax=Saitozyma podzolica TaxID=1890683 RepID=A0A427YWV7_9TREE|nr:hypothetical protein EHS25_000533 [Saitozyma podzolica]